MSTFMISIPHFTGGSSQGNLARKTGIHIEKEEVTLILFADDTIFFVEDPTESTIHWTTLFIKLLELVNEFTRFQDTRST